MCFFQSEWKPHSDHAYEDKREKSSIRTEEVSHRWSAKIPFLSNTCLPLLSKDRPVCIYATLAVGTMAAPYLCNHVMDVGRFPILPILYGNRMTLSVLTLCVSEAAFFCFFWRKKTRRVLYNSRSAVCQNALSSQIGHQENPGH